MALRTKGVVQKTCSMALCPVFGMLAGLSETVLPTYADVMRYYLLMKRTLKPDSSSKEPTVSDISELVAAKVQVVHQNHLNFQDIHAILKQWNVV